MAELHREGSKTSIFRLKVKGFCSRLNTWSTVNNHLNAEDLDAITGSAVLAMRVAQDAKALSSKHFRDHTYRDHCRGY